MPRFILWASIPLVATAIVFAQVRDFEFLEEWDDHSCVTGNPYLHPPSLDGLVHFWRKSYYGLYIPMTYVVIVSETFLAEHPATLTSPYRLDPSIYHLGNLAVHLANVLLVFVVFKRLLGRPAAACAGALLFALHPLMVESVSWVTEIKGLLATFFSLVTVWQYLDWIGARPLDAAGQASGGAECTPREAPAARQRWLHGVTALAAFSLALLSKPSAAALPLVVAVLDVGVLGRPWRRVALAVAGGFILGAAFLVATKWLQPDSGIPISTSPWVRPFVAGDAVAHYLRKLFLPIDLGPDYGRTPPKVLASPWTYVAWLLPVGLAAALAFSRHRRQGWVCLAIFVAGLAPVLGLVQFSFQGISTVADRYVYLAMFGPALALALVVQRHPTKVTFIAVAGLCGLLAMLSYRQAAHWHDAPRLFRYCLEQVNPTSYIAHQNLAAALEREGLRATGNERRQKLTAAADEYRTAIELSPAVNDIYERLGFVESQLGHYDEAIATYEKLLAFHPRLASAHYNVANIYLAVGQTDKAFAAFQRATELNPDHVYAWMCLGNIRAYQGSLSEAVDYYRHAIQTQPGADQPHHNLGLVLAQQGKPDEARAEFAEATRLNPRLAEAHYELGNLALQEGNFKPAIDSFRAAAVVAPENADYQNLLGLALARDGQRVEAIRHFQEALRLNPMLHQARANLDLVQAGKRP